MIIKTEAHFWIAVNEMKKCSEIVIDIETNGLDVWQNARLCGIGIYLPDSDKGFYFPFRHRVDSSDSMPLLMGLEAPDDNLPMDLLSPLLKAIERIPRLIGHNIKFDLD